MAFLTILIDFFGDYPTPVVIFKDLWTSWSINGFSTTSISMGRWLWHFIRMNLFVSRFRSNESVKVEVERERHLNLEISWASCLIQPWIGCC